MGVEYVRKKRGSESLRVFLVIAARITKMGKTGWSRCVAR